jgi:adenosylcobinamide kinase/adenosylcobinamide-phosphate guanylyltransferase
MAKELVLVLGGARSGKSTHAQRMAHERGGESVLYVATAEAWDDEMRTRIAVHKADRPTGWRTLEAPRHPGPQIPAAVAGAQVVLVDCLTLLVSNTVLALGDEADVKEAESAALAEVDDLLAAYRQGDATWIVVSNEVGLGLVPPYPLGRSYRDALGRVNQRLAAEADSVLFMVAGLPMCVK